jgi:hypothetical protein
MRQRGANHSKYLKDFRPFHRFPVERIPQLFEITLLNVINSKGHLCTLDRAPQGHQLEIRYDFNCAPTEHEGT